MPAPLFLYHAASALSLLYTRIDLVYYSNHSAYHSRIYFTQESIF